ncbi:MAG: methyltransferase domain-containing protein [Deltaproteobacteria bacterium]|nr:methyltransferase domain-containing protein [Deltaproteobacteria bacterium]
MFGLKNLKKQEIAGKRVIEVGSWNHNGSLREVIQVFSPKEYVGVDIQEGQGVDVVCDISSLVKKFGKDSFDVVVCTEVVEHVKDWKDAITNLKGVCKPGGIIVLTTRSKGFKYHTYPKDYWRYEVEDMRKIFEEFDTQIEQDPSMPGVFVKAKKKPGKKVKNLSEYALYNIVAGKRVREASARDKWNLHFLYVKAKHLVEQVGYGFYKKYYMPTPKL